MNTELEKLQKAVKEAKTIVFFGGAGVSTESGIPDFRSPDGLYAQKYDVPPETLLSHGYFEQAPEKFYQFYREKMLCTDAQPNLVHKKLAEWERMGKLRAVITQNIDGLHQKAGSKKVLELHGSIYRNHCTRCGEFYGVSAITESTGVPRCKCGGMIKPDVVLYGESLDDAVLEESIACIRAADLLIVGGTSLAVYPAAGLLHYFRGGTLALVNRDITPMDQNANIVLHENLGTVFAKI